jgi:hypothetical protein
MNGTTSHRRVFWRAMIAGVVTFTLLLGVLAPAAASAGKLTCLTGTDPSVAADLLQIAAVRALIDAGCVCASFDATSVLEGQKAGTE